MSFASAAAAAGEDPEQTKPLSLGKSSSTERHRHRRWEGVLHGVGTRGRLERMELQQPVRWDLGAEQTERDAWEGGGRRSRVGSQNTGDVAACP